MYEAPEPFTSASVCLNLKPLDNVSPKVMVASALEALGYNTLSVKLNSFLLLSNICHQLLLSVLFNKTKAGLNPV
jgi:hypothetical protein